MMRFIITLSILASVCVASLAQTANVTYNISDFFSGAAPQPSVVKLTPLAQSANGAYLLLNRSRSMPVGTNSSVTFSNVAMGYSYQVAFYQNMWQQPSCWTNTFPATLSNNVNGASWIYYNAVFPIGTNFVLYLNISTNYYYLTNVFTTNIFNNVTNYGFTSNTIITLTTNYSYVTNYYTYTNGLSGGGTYDYNALSNKPTAIQTATNALTLAAGVTATNLSLNGPVIFKSPNSNGDIAATNNGAFPPSIQFNGGVRGPSFSDETGTYGFTDGGFIGTFPANQLTGIIPLANLPASVTNPAPAFGAGFGIKTNGNVIAISSAVPTNPTVAIASGNLVTANGAGGLVDSGVSGGSVVTNLYQTYQKSKADVSQALVNMNLYQSTNQWAGNNLSRPYTILVIGDSLAANMNDGYMSYLKAKGLYCGGADGVCGNLAGGAYQTNGPVYALLSTASTTYVFPSGSSGTFNYDCAAENVWASCYEIYYWQESGAGTLTVQTALEGGSFNTVGSTNCSGTSLTLKRLDVPLTAGMQQLKISASGGTVRVFQITYGDRMSRGAQIVNLGVGGLDWINCVGFTNWTSVGASVAPNLILAQEISNAGDWQTNFPYVMTNILKGCPNADVVLISPNPTIPTPDDSAENSMIRSIALTNGWGYFDQYDLMQGMGGTNWMIANFDNGKFFTDSVAGAGVHPQARLRYWEVNQLMNAIGFSSMLSINNADDNWITSYGSSGSSKRFGVRQVNSQEVGFLLYGNSVASGSGFKILFQSPTAANGLEGGLQLDGNGYALVNRGGGANWTYNPQSDSILHVTGGFETHGNVTVTGTGLLAMTNGTIVASNLVVNAATNIVGTTAKGQLKITVSGNTYYIDLKQ